MYSLFELRHVIQLNKSDEILYSAYAEVRDKTVLVLACTGSFLLFYVTSAANDKPFIRQVKWFSHQNKEIRSLCLDPFGLWLLVAVADSFLYIVPVPTVGGHQPPKGSYSGRTDDITDVRISGQRASPTCVKWWTTSDGQHIAIVGNELGEVIFVNLKTKKEIGSTYIHATENEKIYKLDLIQDEENGVTSILITDCAKHQWHLILEDCKTDYCWLTESDSEIHVGVGNVDCKLWQMQGERSLFIEDKRKDGRPRRISRYEGISFLFPQVLQGRSVIAAYTSSQGKLHLLPGTLELPYLNAYDVPENCECLLSVDKFLFFIETCDLTANYIFHVVSSHFANVAQKGKEFIDTTIQKFTIQCSHVLSLYKRSASYYLAVLRQSQRRSKDSTSVLRALMNNSPHHANAGNSSKLLYEKQAFCDALTETSLDGCFIIHKKGVIECRPTSAPERQFLSLTFHPDDLPMAERLGVMLSLNIGGLYEIGAEVQLAQGHFAQAVRLYQLSKCPQLKRVAHFVSYGFLSELIAYIQVLFTTKSVDVAPADRSHFANIAMHCFVQQILNRKNERHVVVQAFRDFLRDNLYYDDEVAIRLLSEQGLYELLHFCSSLRGQQRLMLEHLLCSDCQRESVDQQAHDAIINSGYSAVLTRTQNEHYLRCITSPSLLQHMAIKPQLLKCHIQHLAHLLPKMSIDLLLRAATLYDPSHPAAELAVRSVLTFHNQRYFSMSSLSSISSDSLDLTHGDDESMNEEELIKFFIFIVLLLNNKRGESKYQAKLMQNGSDRKMEAINKRRNLTLGVSLSCGLSHSALVKQGNIFTWGKGQFGRLGHGEVHQESSQPMHVDLLYLKVLSVSCGVFHTLAVTDYGIFGWGSSKYGQLGMGELQRTPRPLMIEALARQDVVKVTCGQYHSLAVTADGRVYSWGWGVHGQLGHGSVEDVLHPKEIEFFTGKIVISAAAGHGHSAILVKSGDVYTFGCGMFGQLGLGTVVKHSIPQAVHLLEPIVQIASGYFHMLVLSCNNKLYTWGCNPQALRLQAQTTRRARLQGSQVQDSPGYGTSPHLPISAMAFGQNTLSQNHLFPSIVQTSVINAKISTICCGSHHSALLTSDGEVFTWGRNTDGQLGHGTRKEQKCPTMLLSLNDRKVTHIACGCDFMLAYDSTGRLWGWGQNDGGQLGQKSMTENRVQPTSSHHNQGRVITIRTNRRMITFTQNCRQGELRPVEVISLPSVPGILAVDLDSSSIDNDVNLLHQMDYYHKTHTSPVIPHLPSMDEEPYGPIALHAILKAFHRYYDPSAILNHCINFGNWQAAAKLCALEGLYAQALEYQLKAAGAAKLSKHDLAISSLEVIKFYLKYVDPENFESNKLFLSHAIAFWEEHSLAVEPLEPFLSSHLGLLGYPLGLLLFCEGQKKTEVLSFQQKLSTDFSIEVSLAVIDHIHSGKPHPDLLEHLVQTSCMVNSIQETDSGLGSWESSLPPHTLWKELLHNFQKGALARSSVHLAPSSVDALSKAVIAEDKQKQDVVVFTCGHHYTRHNFNTLVIPSFREDLHKLPMSLPQTERLLLSGFQSEGTIPTACPPCVLTEIKSS